MKLPFKFVYNVSKEEKKARDKIKRYGLSGLFRYANIINVLLMLGGACCSLMVGSAGPLIGLVFGSMTDTLTRASLNGISDGNAEANNTSLYNVTSSSAEGPISKNEFLTEMNRYSLYYLYIGLMVFFCQYLAIYLWELSSEVQIFKLRKIFFLNVMRQDLEWFDTNQHGDLASKLTDDLERVKEGIGHKFGMVLMYMSTMISGTVVGLTANWKLTGVMLLISPFVLGSSAYLAKVVSGGAAKEQLKYSFAGKIAEESLTCLRTVTAFGGERVEIKRYDDALRKGKILSMKKYYSMSAGGSIVYFITYSTYGLAFWYSSVLIENGEATVGSVFTVFFSMLSGALAIGPLMPYLNSVLIAVGASDVVINIIDRVPHIDPYSDEGAKPEHLTGKIEFRDVYFTYPTRKDFPVLTGLNFAVRQGQTAAFIGSSGTGKSTIVNLLMRFYDVTQGQILLDGQDTRKLNLKWLRENIGIVSQEPVLFDTSIAENIRYGREGVTMEDIIHAAEIANAHEFIKSLPDGYNTRVGDRAAQMSGGQKQRIAIARALVRDPKILLLDEATSALDAKSEGIVQDSLDSAKRGRTTLIIAHRLSTIKDSDVIFSMKGGKIVESGTHSELMAMRGLYFDLVNLQKKGEKEEQSESEDDRGEEQGLYEHRMSLGAPRDSIYEEVTEKKDKALIWKIFKANQPEWGRTLIGATLCAMDGIIIPAFSILYAQMFETFQLDKKELERQVPVWSGLFVGLAVVEAINFAISVLCLASAGENLLERLRSLCFKNIIQQQISWFDGNENSSGRLLTLLAREAPIMKTVGVHGHISFSVEPTLPAAAARHGTRVGPLVSALIMIITATALAFVFGWQLALLMMFVTPILLVTSYQQMKRLRTALIISNEAMLQAGKVASDGVQNVKTVQSLSCQKNFLMAYDQALQAPMKENKKQAFWLAVICGLAYGAPYFVYAAAFKLGSYLLVVELMTPANMYRVFFSVTLSAASIGGTIAYFSDFSKGKAAAESMFRVIEKKSDADPLSEAGADHEAKGNISFEKVHFAYPSRPDEKVLNGLSLEVAAGETVALVGESGCGKSTTISLLERFYSPLSGIIKMDGMSIDKIKLSSLRRQMGLVTQEPVLFSGTIKYNIAYGANDRELSDTEIIEAAKLANIHEFICTLPLRYETLCGDRGTQLSGGQKQRIAIARALVRNPKILLLDEATSALDVESEKVVQQALDRAREGRTSLVISHRLSTVQNAHKIVVVQKGVVTECGTHRELIAKEGFYAQLVKRQQM